MTNNEIKHFTLKYDEKILSDLSLYPENENYFAVLRPKNSQYFNSSKLIIYKIEKLEHLEEVKENFLNQFCGSYPELEIEKIQFASLDIPNYKEFYDKFISAMESMINANLI